MSERFVVKYLEIAESDIVGNVLYFLNCQDDDSASMLEVVKELDLSEDDVKEVTSSEFIEIDAEESATAFSPVWSLDRKKVDEELENVELNLEKEGSVRKVEDWMDNELSSVSKDTHLDVQQDIVEKARQDGFSEATVEEELDSRLNGGLMYEPKPGKVSKL